MVCRGQPFSKLAQKCQRQGKRHVEEVKEGRAPSTDAGKRSRCQQGGGKRSQGLAGVAGPLPVSLGTGVESAAFLAMAGPCPSLSPAGEAHMALCTQVS